MTSLRSSPEEQPSFTPEPHERLDHGPGGAEFALAIVALLVLHRSPVVFFRDQTADIFGGPIAGPWQDDALVRLVFLGVEAAVLMVAIRVCGMRSLRPHWPLLTFLGFVLISTAWSVERASTAPRAVMFVGTAAVGWYLGQRFRLDQQVLIVATAAAVGALASVSALVIWPDLARSTAGVPGRWSGIYVNRNHLGIVMTVGLLALAFALCRLRGVARLGALGLGFLEGYLCWRSGSRTGPVALIAVAGLLGFVALSRKMRRFGLTTRRGAGATALVGAVTWYGLHQNWGTAVGWLGRSTTLTRRTTIWALDRHFIDQRPWKGWGFEAIWANRPTAEQAAAAFQTFFGDAHSGYYEIVLGVGKIGFGLFMIFFAVTIWRTFAYAWEGQGLEVLWPLALVSFVAVANFSESFFVSNEALWALFVCAGVTAARSRHVGVQFARPRLSG